MKKIYILGKDKRQLYLRELYIDNLVDRIEDSDIVIFPIPFSKDNITITGTNIKTEDIVSHIRDKIVFGGVFSEKTKKIFNSNNIKYYDLMEFEELAIKNAIPTAEGTVAKVMENLDKTIFKSNILILGFGKCGKILADRFSGLKANVFCEARNQKDIAQIISLGYNDVDITNLEKILPEMDVVINTIPYRILDKEKIDCMKKGVVVIDIASNPGGTDFEYCRQKNVSAFLELGIPAKVAPKSASKYIKEIIDKII